MNTRELEEKTTIGYCAEACSNSTDCCSFEFSPSREICSFNKGCVPTHVQFQDNICCIPNEKGCRSQFFPGIIFIVTEICDQPSSIVTSSEYDEDTTGENVLSDCIEETSDKYWKAPTGSEAEIVLDQDGAHFFKKWLWRFWNNKIFTLGRKIQKKSMGIASQWNS